jgi:uncharacterized damage-inducible protein DinB
MDVAQLLVEIYDRLPPLVRDAVDGLTPAQLVEQPAPDANTVGWLIWHTARVVDDHIADVMGVGQLWAEGDWAARFGLEPDVSNIGYGHTAEEMARVRPESAAALTEYFDAAHARAVGWLATLKAGDLDRVVDTRWDPPVTLGVRLVSVADDSLQHVGQAAYVRGSLLGSG